MFTRLIFILAWGGFFFQAVAHNTNWLFWLCAALVFIDRWIVLPFLLRVMSAALLKISKEKGIIDG